MSKKADHSNAPSKRAPTLYFIVAIKLGKSSLLLIAAISIFLLAHKNLPDMFDQFIRFLHLDPEGRFFNAIGDRLETVTPGNVHVIASWMFLYGLFMMVGGLGLAFRVPWAVWLAIGESAFFIPIEIFELIRNPSPEGAARAHALFAHPKVGLGIVLAVNVLIVWYLYANRQRLFRHHH
jgi:uncharacterized membrane protein (DUF2068 family)